MTGHLPQLRKKYLHKTPTTGIVEYTIVFDKDLYFPGDVVNATFSCTGPFPSKLRKIQFSLVSGEMTSVTYSTGGNPPSQSTAVEETNYAEVFAVVIPDTMGRVEQSLEFTLPKRSYFPIKEQGLHVFHQARIKYDIAKSRDVHASLDIPYKINLDLASRFADAITSEVATVSIGKQVYFAGDIATLNFDAQKQFKIRGFRVEVIQQINRKAERHKASGRKKFKIATLSPDHNFPVEIILPQMQYPTMEGVNFKIFHYVKLILDKARSRDMRFEIPFQFYPGAMREYRGLSQANLNAEQQAEITNCPECSSILPVDGAFCEQCGFKINRVKL